MDCSVCVCVFVCLSVCLSEQEESEPQALAQEQECNI